MPELLSPRQNRLLAALPDADRLYSFPAVYHEERASAKIAVQVIKVPGILPTAMVIILALGAFLSFKAYRRGS